LFERDETKDTTMKDTRSTTPVTLQRRQADSTGHISKGQRPNDDIKFLAVGVSEKGGKFLLVARGDRYVVLSVRGLRRDPQAEFDRLEALDVEFLVPKARNDFLRQAQEATKMAPTFEVATQIGWHDDLFILPDRVYPPQPPIQGMPKGLSRILVHLDAKDDDVHSRFRCHGSPRKSQELFRLCRGNSRLIFAAALSFVGPCCKPFRLRAPGCQAVGIDGSGKTIFLIVAGATFGGVPASTLGFGSAWNGTPNGLEDYGPAHRDTLMALDETSLLPTDPKGRTLAFGEALMRLAQGQGKKRYGLGIDRWSNVLVSSSNFSVYALLDAKRREKYGAYTDRLIDIPTPNHSASFFEELHGFKDSSKFGKYLFDLATHNFGYPIRVFLYRLTAELDRDREGFTAFVNGNIGKYENAAEGIKSSRPSVLRVHGYFATVYAVGCLAIRFKILPFTEAELRAAVLSCHRDHVAFVDNEVAGGAEWTATVPAASPTGAAGGMVATPPEPAGRPYDRLRRFVVKNRKGGFRDVSKPGVAVADTIPVAGYVAGYGEQKEYRILDSKFTDVAGGEEEAKALKRELFQQGLIVTHGHGDKLRFVVKRSVPGIGRTYVVALRAKRKK
jgi:hypothetical protein